MTLLLALLACGGTGPAECSYFVAGCDPAPNDVLPDEGVCYEECGQPDAVCTTGTCTSIYVNPCIATDGSGNPLTCQACGGSQRVCM